MAPRRVEIVEIERPEIEAGQILVKTDKGCLCGTDLPFFFVDPHHPITAGMEAPLPPMLSLHECVGYVAESRCAEYREGDAVLALPYAQQGLAEYFPSEPANAVPIPTDCRWDHLVLAQPLGTVLHAAAKIGSVLNPTDVAPLVTHRFPLDRAQEAFDTFADHRDGAIKVVIDFARDT